MSAKFSRGGAGSFFAGSLFGFEGRVWDLIVSVPDHCLSFYFTLDEVACVSAFFNGIDVMTGAIRQLEMVL